MPFFRNMWRRLVPNYSLVLSQMSETLARVEAVLESSRSSSFELPLNSISQSVRNVEHVLLNIEGVHQTTSEKSSSLLTLFAQCLDSTSKLQTVVEDIRATATQLEVRTSTVQAEHTRSLSQMLEATEAIKRAHDLATDHLWHIRYHLWDNLKMQRLAALGPDKVVTFSYQGSEPIHFWVPKGHIDHIQSHYLLYEHFWEEDLLRELLTFTQEAFILDVGANVGNHTVFWAKIAKAKHVDAFEPIYDTFHILERNVSLNKLDNVSLHRIALGAHRTKGTGIASPSSMMMASVKTADEGDIQILPLDDIKIPAVDFMKVDVEGNTLPLLKGATRTLTEYRPVIFVELFAHERAACEELLGKLGYTLAKSFREDNFLFIHKDYDREVRRDHTVKI